MTSPETSPEPRGPAPSEPSPAADGAAIAATDEAPAVPEAEYRRTHPVTPLVSGWKVIAGIVALVSIQNINALIEEFTLSRLLIGVGILLAVAVLSIVVSALSWRFTTYAITPEGVVLRTGILTRSRRFAPREKIDSVSVEKPIIARALGLAKVRVEVAGGGESHLDIALVRSSDADRIRREILATATPAPSPAPQAGPAGRPGDPDPTESAAVAAGASTATVSAWDAVVHDGVSDGEEIARVPTVRLLHSMVRDIEFLVGVVLLAATLTFAVVVLLWDEGPGPGVLISILPAVVAVPRLVLGKIESGWGFISRDTEHGLRMRRGLFNTRTDNVAAGRIQMATLSQPWLWRSQHWTRAKASIAGIGEESVDGALAVLPVGTPEELRRTMGHLLPPLGTPDDVAFVTDMLDRRARDIDGIRATRRWQWIARRTEVIVVLPEFVVRRHGILSRTLQLVPRERILGTEVSQGPIARRLDLLRLDVRTAKGSLHAEGMPAHDILALAPLLDLDASRKRRYVDRGSWPQPVLSGAPAIEEGTEA